ncbi:sphingomyelinase C-like [Saccoglossus kowalevskii]|uniref:sphingomyelin phosphodiesterase n=1 Tax=Saccoglossus kowalevskii TaxID=10224 RepID=A0ABM0GWW8_SACKO|nr:PREDICTED: uncharacterized protein LOC100373634 [Saccoglossus kowalevskii]
MEFALKVVYSMCLLSVTIAGSIYDIGTGPFCNASPEDCEDRGDEFIGYFQDTCWAGNKVWCKQRATVKGQEWVGAGPFCNTLPSDCRTRFLKYATSAKCGDGSCCVTGIKRLCVPDEKASSKRFGALAMKPKLKVWLGSSPMCDGKCSDCALYGMSCAGKDMTGDGDTCLSGKKVMCLVPEAPALWSPCQANILKVLSYNVRELDFMYVHDGQRERTCRIPRRIVEQLGDVDVIVLQEVFMGGCFPGVVSLRDLFRHHGFPHMTNKVGDRDTGFLEDGGVYIVSRWPITEQHETIFEATHYMEADAFAAKGVIYAKIIKTVKGTSRNYHVFGTHMQAQIGDIHDSVREDQAKEMRAFMKDQNIPFSEPVIYAGDFNCDVRANHRHVRRVLGKLNAGIPPRVGKLTATFDPTTNDMFEDKNQAPGPEWLDYVVYSKDHLKPWVSTLEGIKLTSKTQMEICSNGPFKPSYMYPDSSFCSKKRTITDLSDHYPVLGMFMFP